MLDEKALLSCMAYVDLNPVRAGMAATPEDSEHTSIKQRADSLDHQGASPAKPHLVPLVDADNIEAEEESTVCRIRLMDYLQLVDATGRALREDKRGAIDAHAADILERLGIDNRAWLRHMSPRKQRVPLAIGAINRLKAFAEATGRQWVSGQKAACLLG